jgi:hypothetical protein
VKAPELAPSSVIEVFLALSFAATIVFCTFSYCDCGGSYGNAKERLREPLQIVPTN